MSHGYSSGTSVQLMALSGLQMHCWDILVTETKINNVCLTKTDT